MSKFKSLTALTVIIVLALLAGCSDEFISPSANVSNTGKDAGQNGDDILPVNYLHIQVRLKPRKAYTLNFSNTGFYTFHTLSVSKCSETKDIVDIVAYNNTDKFQLDCDSKRFTANSINLLNKSSNFVDLDLYLTGSKVKVIYPEPKE